MTAPIAAGRTGGLQFQLLGVPVTIHWTFLLIIGLFGLDLGGPARIVVWIAIATAAVMLHEFGHAIVGRRAGLTPRIDLAGMGGLTSWDRHDHADRARGRGWSIAISLAGPGFGFVGGFLVLLMTDTTCCWVSTSGTLFEFALSVWVFACFAWGVLNLMPIMPLDGGQALRELLPGSPVERYQRAAIIGVAVAGLGAAWALVNNQTYLALLSGYFAYTNFTIFQQTRRQPAAVAGSTVAPADGPVAPVSGASATLGTLAREGRHEEAWLFVIDPRRTDPLPPEHIAWAAHQAITHVPARRSVSPGVLRTWQGRWDDDGDGASVLALLLAFSNRHADALALAEQVQLSPEILEATQVAIHADGDHELAARFGVKALQALGGRAPTPASVRVAPVLSYNTACSLARVGRDADALEALTHARRLGFSDLQSLREDPDLATLRTHPGWTSASGL